MPTGRTGATRRGLAIRRAAGALVAAVLAVQTATPAASGRSFLWKASAPDHHAVYLVGSVHLLSKDFYPLRPALETAFSDSDLLVEEVDLGQALGAQGQLELLTRGLLANGQTLDAVVSPAAFSLVSTRAADIGLPMAAVSRFKPWMVALTLAGLEWQKAGFDPGLGLDKHFYDLAAEGKKPVQGLETAEYQISRFDGMSMAQQEKMLTETLKELDTEQGNVTRLAQAWREGDVPTVEHLVVGDLKDSPEMYQRLLVDRNRNWLPKIEALFTRPGRAFVVVGAAHLVGPDGLLAMLTARGYTIEQL